MSEKTDPTPEVPESPVESEGPAPVSPAKRTFRQRLAGSGERVYGIRGLVAATLAALIVGGVGGAAIHAAVDGPGHDQGRFSRGGPPGGPGFDGRGPGDFDPRGPGDFEQGPGGVPGQVPPTTPPEDDSDS